MLSFHFQPSKKEVEKARFFSEQIEDLVRQGRFEYVLAEQLLGKYAYPDAVMSLSQEIKSTQLPKDGHWLLESAKEDGPTLISAAIGISKYTAKQLVKDPTTAHILFRSLRDKLEEMKYKKERSNAESHGFIAMIIHTIKRAMRWIIKKFNDIKDDFMDIMAERPPKSSQTKRDYNWITDTGKDYLINNTDWYIDSEH